MKFVAILSLGLTVVNAADPACTAYVCDSKDATWAGETTCGTASKSNPTTYYVRSVSCPSGQACSLAANGADSVCQSITPPVYSRYPGEPCDKTYTCGFGNTCTDGKCSGTKAAESTCVNPYDCDVSMTCSGKVCVALAQPEKPCTLDTDCVQSAGCVGGTCVSYLSIAAGQAAPGGCANSSNNPYCSTGYCFSSDNTCADVVSSPQGSIPIKCTTGTNTCSSVKDSAGKTVEGSCNCAYDGNFYCSLYPGDSEVSDYYSDLKSFLSSAKIQECSSSRRATTGVPSYALDECWRHVWASEKEIYRYYKGTTYETFATSDKCVLKLVNPDLYTAEDAALLTLAGLALLN